MDQAEKKTQLELPLLIFGTGQQAQVAWHNFVHEHKRQVAGFVSDLEDPPRTLLNLPVFGLRDIRHDLEAGRAEIFVAVGSIALNTVREYYVDLLIQAGANVISCISPGCYRADTPEPGKNVYIDATSIVCPFTRLGNNVILFNASVSHHCLIGDNVSINGARIGANCRIGRNSVIALSATIESGVTIGDYCLVDSGALVKRDLPSYSVASVLPSRIRSVDSRRIKLFGESYFGFRRRKGGPHLLKSSDAAIS